MGRLPVPSSFPDNRGPFLAFGESLRRRLLPEPALDLSRLAWLARTRLGFRIVESDAAFDAAPAGALSFVDAPSASLVLRSGAPREAKLLEVLLAFARAALAGETGVTPAAHSDGDVAAAAAGFAAPEDALGALLADADPARLVRESALPLWRNGGVPLPLVACSVALRHPACSTVTLTEGREVLPSFTVDRFDRGLHGVGVACAFEPAHLALSRGSWIDGWRFLHEGPVLLSPDGVLCHAASAGLVIPGPDGAPPAVKSTEILWAVTPRGPAACPPSCPEVCLPRRNGAVHCGAPEARRGSCGHEEALVAERLRRMADNVAAGRFPAAS